MKKLFYIMISCTICLSFFSCVTWSGIINASRNGNIKYLEYVLEQDKSLKAYDMEYNTPLIIASLSGQNETVEFLLEHGADINEKNNAHYSALDSALTYRRLDTAKLLISKGAQLDMNTHMLIVGYNFYEIIDYLLDKGYNLGLSLHIAASSEKSEIVKYLLEHGVDVDSLNSDNSTPLMSAVEMLKRKNIEILLEYDPDVNAMDNKKRFPLFIASSRGDLDIVKLLIEKGANINQKGTFGLSPLMVAVGFSNNHSDKNLPIIKYLIEQGADISIADDNGETVLDYIKAMELTELEEFVK